jgi:hypothetical protein
MYLLSVLAVLVVVSVVPAVLSDPLNQPIGDFAIPNWVKNTAGWWADDKIPDSVFLQGIQFLIKEEIITVQIPAVDSVVEEIPGWVKNTAGWWADDKIQDITFVAAVRYLVSQGIVYVEREQVEEPVEEVEEITDFYMEVNGSNCCLNWGYVGKEYRFQIETFDEKRGSPIDGVTITVKIISKGGELRHNFGEVTTEDGFYKNSITIPSLDWYAGNILFVTGEYYGVEKTIEKEFEVFYKKSSRQQGCSNNSPFSVASQDIQPQSIAFNSDGTKLFILGANDDDVNEYTLGIAYCLDNPQFVDSFSVTSQEKLPTSVAFNTDGTKMFILGFTTAKKVFEYTLSTGFDVSTASFVDAFSVVNQDNKPQEIAFNDDGTKMFMVGDQRDKVWEYTLSTGFDVSTASVVDGFSIASEEDFAGGMAFNDDGTKMFVVGRTADAVFEYTLSTGFDVSTTSYVDSFSVADQEDLSTGIAFNSDGTKMFIVGAAGDEVNVYKLSTGFDVSTAVAQSG